MVANEMEEWISFCEVSGAPHGMPVSARFTLIDKRKMAGMIACYRPKSILVVGMNDEAHIIDSCATHLFDDHGED
jgi:hypothetical protein